MAEHFDLRQSSVLLDGLPGLRAAFNAPSMARTLGHVLGTAVVACAPGRALFEPDDFCMVRYKVELNGGEQLVVSARLFRSAEAADAFRARALDPLAADLDGRTHRPRVARLAASVPELAMAVSVFPLDAELPALVRITDPDETTALLKGASLPAPHRLSVTNYARRRRCTLRCEAGEPPSAQIAYLKVANDGGGRVTAAATRAIRGLDAGFMVPPVLVDRPDLGLTVLGAIPGSPRVAKLLRARVRGSEPLADAPSLEEAIATCGQIAATLHRAELPGARRRTLGFEIAALRGQLDVARSLTPELAARIGPAVDDLESRAPESWPDPDVTAHGDFSYSQLLFSDSGPGVVDFDGVCRAEAALDLGHFLAYVRFAVVKAADSYAADFAALETDLEVRFLDAYRSANGPDAGPSDERIRLYETASMIRLALHAWQKMKPVRLGWLLAALDARRTATR